MVHPGIAFRPIQVSSPTADNTREGHGRTGPGKDGMAHGRTIGEQSVMGLPTGVNVNVFQSNDAPTRVFLAVSNGPADAHAYLSPLQARELARKLLAEAEHAEAFADSLERDALDPANRGRGLAGVLADIKDTRSTATRSADAHREAERASRLAAEAEREAPSGHTWDGLGHTATDCRCQA